MKDGREKLSKNTDGVNTEEFLSEPYEIHVSGVQQRKENDDKERIELKNKKRA